MDEPLLRELTRYKGQYKLLSCITKSHVSPGDDSGAVTAACPPSGTLPPCMYCHTQDLMQLGQKGGSVDSSPSPFTMER